MNFKLGKKAPDRLLKTPAFGDFLSKAKEWPKVAARGWENAVPANQIGMLGNDKVGDCVVAMMMHYAQVETANTGNPLTPTTELALQVYSAITHYDPKLTDPQGDNPTDNGMSIQGQALPYWKSHGIPMLDKNGKEVIHKILGWATLDLTSIAQQRYACDVFGGNMLGIYCPMSAQDDTSNWVYDPNSPIAGGHGVPMLGQGGAGWHTISWGVSIPGTWEFSLKLADEMYSVVTPLWLDQQGKSPSGLDLDGLLAAMKSL